MRIFIFELIFILLPTIYLICKDWRSGLCIFMLTIGSTVAGAAVAIRRMNEKQ